MRHQPPKATRIVAELTTMTTPPSQQVDAGTSGLTTPPPSSDTPFNSPVSSPGSRPALMRNGKSILSSVNTALRNAARAKTSGRDLETIREREFSSTPELNEPVTPAATQPVAEGDPNDAEQVEMYTQVMDSSAEVLQYLKSGLFASQDRIPTIITTLVHLATLNTPMQVVTYLLDKVVTECEPSIVAIVRSFMIADGVDVTPQSPGFEVLGTAVLHLSEAYESFKTHAAWQRLARVVIASIAGLFVATRVVSTRKASDLVKAIGGVVSLNALVGGNLFEDALYVVKSIVKSLTSGEGLFTGFNDADRHTLEIRYAQAIALKEVFITQDWAPAVERNKTSTHPVANHPVDDCSYYGFLDHLAADLRLKIGVTDTKKTSADLFYYTRCYATIGALRNQVSESVKRAGFKPAAYAFGLLGNSGIGKSVLVELIVSTLLKNIGYEDVKRLISNINSGDEYLSGLHNGHKAVIFDDAASRKHYPGGTASDEMEVVRNFVGNQPIPLVSAAIEDKGRIMPFVDVVALTTNVPYLNSIETANCPYSVLRRLGCMINVRTKREFWRSDYKDGGMKPISDTLVPQASGTINTDVYLFDVMRAREERGSSITGLTASASWVYSQDDGKELKNLSWTELMLYLIKRFRAHVEDQRGKVVTMQEFFATPPCSHGLPHGTCDLCRADPAPEIQVQVQAPPLRTTFVPDPTAQSNLNKFFTTCGLFKDIMTSCDPWSMLDPLGALCRTKAYQEAAVNPEFHRGTETWLVKFIMTRAWVKSLLCALYAVIHGALAALMWILILLVLLGPTTVFIYLSCALAATVFIFVSLPAPFGLATGFATFCAFSSLCGFWIGLIMPFSAILAGVVLVGLGLVRLWIAMEFIKVMVFISHLDADRAARLQDRRIFTVNTRAISSISAFLCMFIGGRILYRLTRRAKQVDVSPSGLFISAPARAEPYVPEGPPILPAVPVPPTERQFNTTCSPPVNLTTPFDIWERKDIYQRFPPPPEHLMTTSADTLKRRMESATFRIELKTDSGQTVTQTGFFIHSNWFLINAHAFYDPSGAERPFKNYRIFRKDGSKASGPIWRRNWVRLEKLPSDPEGVIPDTVLIFLPSAPSSCDLLPMLVDTPPPVSDAYVYGLDNSANAYCFSTRVKHHIVQTNALGCLSALEYSCSTELEVGYCGHPIIDLQRKVILGLHCSKITGVSNRYFGSVISASSVTTAMRKLRGANNLLPPMSSASYPAYGVIPSSLTYGPVSNNSVLLQDELANISVLPSVKGYVQPRYRVQFERSQAADVLEARGLPCRHLPSFDYGKFSVDKGKIADTKEQATIPPEYILAAAEVCHEEDRAVFEHLPPNSLGLLSLEDAINGVGLLSHIPRSTSAGFPFQGKKRDYLTEMTLPDGSIRFSPTPQLEREVRVIWATLASGQRVNAVYKSCHKAELVKPGKGTRVFEGINLPFYLVMRMCFGAITAAVTAFAIQLSTVGGINPFGRDWDALHKWMSDLFDEIAGDYRKFDMSGEPQEKHVTMTKLLDLMREYGNYDEETLRVAAGCLIEHINHIALFRGDLAEFFGPTASGCFMTLFVGNRINRQRLVAVILYLFDESQSIAYGTRPLFNMPITTTAGYTLPPDYRYHVQAALNERGLISVFDYVIMVTQGDDFRIRVDKANTPFINQRSIQAVFKKWNITITDSQKNAVFEDLYTPEDEIDFLKRGDRYDDELEIVRAPLVLTSIFKPFYYYEPSCLMTEKLYLAGLIPVSEMELHMHGREVYDEYQTHLEAIVTELELQDYLAAPLRSYDEVTTWWRRRYAGLDAISDSIPYYEVIPQSSEYCTYCSTSHVHVPGAEMSRAQTLFIRFLRMFNDPYYSPTAMERNNREIDCLFRRHNGLEAEFAAAFDELYDLWASVYVPC